MYIPLTGSFELSRIYLVLRVEIEACGMIKLSAILINQDLLVMDQTTYASGGRGL